MGVYPAHFIVALWGPIPSVSVPMRLWGELHEDCWEANWALYFAVLSQRVAYVQMQREDYRLIGIGFI